MTKRKESKGERPAVLVTLPPKRLKDARNRTIIDLPERAVWMSAEMAADHRSAAELMAVLKSGSGLSWTDLERYATHPPMTGQRLLSIILAFNDLTAEERANVKRATTAPARARAVEAKTKRDGRDWREQAREIARGDNPKTGKPWRTKEQAKQYIGDKFGKSLSAVNRALKPNQGR